MSSANPTRIDEFKNNVTFGYCSSQLLVTNFTICLFQSFKERVRLPVGEALRLLNRTPFLPPQALVLLRECKGKSFLQLVKLKAKKINIFSSLFVLKTLPVEAGCKGTVSFLHYTRGERIFL